MSKKKADDGGDVSGAKFWLSLLKAKRETVAGLKQEIAESQAAIAKRAKKKAPKTSDKGYADNCRALEQEWNQIRIREEAIEAFTKKPVLRTPRPTVCPPPTVFKFWGTDNEHPDDARYNRDYDPWASWAPEAERKPQPSKPAGYDERKAGAEAEWTAYKARGLWGAIRRVFRGRRRRR